MILPNTECSVISISVVHITKFLSDRKKKLVPLLWIVVDYTHLPEFLLVLLLVSPVSSVK